MLLEKLIEIFNMFYNQEISEYRYLYYQKLLEYLHKFLQRMTIKKYMLFLYLVITKNYHKTFLRK